MPLGSKYEIDSLLRCSNCFVIFSSISSEKPVKINFAIVMTITPFSKPSLKENRSDCRFAVSGAVQGNRPEQKAVRWAILFKLIPPFI